MGFSSMCPSFCPLRSECRFGQTSVRPLIFDIRRAGCVLGNIPLSLCPQSTATELLKNQTFLESWTVYVKMID